MMGVSKEQDDVKGGSVGQRVGISFYAFMLFGASDGALGVLLPSIIAQYAIDTATASLLFPASALGYLIAALTSGLLLERLGRRILLMLGAASFLFGAALVWVTPPFFVLPLALLCIGSGEGIFDAGLNAYFAGLPRSGGLLNYLHTCYGVGALLGPLIAASILARSWGWSTTYGAWAGGGLLALIGFALAFSRHDSSTAQHSDGDDEGAQGNVLLMALSLPLVWLSALFLFFYVGAEVSLGAWSYSLLTERRHEAALISSGSVSGYWLGLTVGRLVLGWFVERIGGQRTILACLVGAISGIVLLWVAPNATLGALGLWLTGFSLGPIFPTTIAYIGALLPSRLQQSAIGFAASLGSVGAAFFPWMVGILASWLGLWALLPFEIALALVMLVFWLALRRSRRPEPALAPEVAAGWPH